MPIPTDTFGNIRRLNVAFALSAIARVAVSWWAVMQDYDKAWRPLQQQGRVWEAALTDERIHRLNTKDVQNRLAELNQRIDAKKKELEQKDKEYQAAAATVKQDEAKVSNIQFEYNNRKATVGVMEANLQDANTRGDKEAARRIRQELEQPERTLSAQR